MSQQRRQNEPNSQELFEQAQQRLLLGITHNVKNIAENEPNLLPLTRGAVAVASQMTMTFVENLAFDVKLFSNHAMRKTTLPSDILLSARKSEEVQKSLKEYIEVLKENTKKRGREEKSRGKRATSTSSTTAVSKKRKNSGTPSRRKNTQSKESSQTNSSRNATTKSKQKHVQDNTDDDDDDDDVLQDPFAKN